MEETIDTLQEAYEPEQVYELHHEAEIVMQLYESLQHIAIERSAEMDSFVFHAYKKMEAAFETAERNVSREFLKRGHS